jgi:hypothetical protein
MVFTHNQHQSRPFLPIFAIFGQLVGISPKFVSFEPFKSHLQAD